MARLFQPSTDIDSANGLEIPVRLLKQILVGHGVKLGGRVLVVGCHDGELVAFLDSLAYNVEVIDDSFPAVEAAQHRFPQFDFEYVRLDEALPVDPGTFDLILIQETSVYRGNLLGLRSRSVTANLLSCLKPGADLVFINRSGPSDDESSRHGANCWKRHLACFPGQFETATYPESWFHRARWDWLLGQRNHSDFFTVTLQLPPQQLDRAAWYDLARRGLMTGHGECCPAKMQLPRIPLSDAA